jgi:hypothetical protein
MTLMKSHEFQTTMFKINVVPIAKIQTPNLVLHRGLTARISSLK